jgi:hypothetical protein
LMLCVGILESLVMTGSNQKMLQKFQELYEIAESQLEVRMDHKKFKQKLKKKNLMVVLFLILHVIFAAVGYDDTEGYIFGKIVGTAPLCASIASCYKIVFYVELVNFYLKFLEEIATKVLNNQPIAINDNIIYYLETKTSNEQSKLKALRKFYNLTKECAELQNKSYGLTILLIMCTSVVTFVFAGFNVYIGMLGKRRRILEGE